MKKKFLPTLTLLTISSVLVGCGTTATVPIERVYVVEPEDFKLNAYSLTLYVNLPAKLKAEDAARLITSFQMETIMNPAQAHAATVSWESADETIAKVSKDGLITAVKEGVTTVKSTYKSETKTIEKVITVYVASYTKKGKDFYAKLDTVKTAQKTNYPKGLDKVHCLEVRTDEVYKNGVLQTSLLEYSDFLVSKSEGYFAIDGIDYETKCADGSLLVTPYKWIFITDEDYNTHMYHEGNNQKNLLNVKTQSFLGQPRVEAVYSILDAIFSSGRKIMDNVFSNALGSSRVDYVQLKSAIKNGFTLNDDTVGYTLGSEYEDSWDYDYEKYWNIPYLGNSKISVNFNETNTWVNGVVRNCVVTQSMSYDFQGDHYEEVLAINYTFEVEDEVNLVMPNNKEYKIVADLFEL